MYVLSIIGATKLPQYSFLWLKIGKNDHNLCSTKNEKHIFRLDVRTFSTKTLFLTVPIKFQYVFLKIMMFRIHFGVTKVDENYVHLFCHVQSQKLRFKKKLFFILI